MRSKFGRCPAAPPGAAAPPTVSTWTPAAGELPGTGRAPTTAARRRSPAPAHRRRRPAVQPWARRRARTRRPAAGSSTRNERAAARRDRATEIVATQSAHDVAADEQAQPGALADRTWWSTNGSNIRSRSAAGTPGPVSETSMITSSASPARVTMATSCRSGRPRRQRLLRVHQQVQSPPAPGAPRWPPPRRGVASDRPQARPGLHLLAQQLEHALDHRAHARSAPGWRVLGPAEGSQVTGDGGDALDASPGQGQLLAQVAGDTARTPPPRQRPPGWPDADLPVERAAHALQAGHARR